MISKQFLKGLITQDAFFGEAVEGILRQDDVVKERDIEEGAGRFDFGCGHDVTLAGESVAGGMVVEENHGNRVHKQSAFDNRSCVYRSTCQSAFGEHLADDDGLVFPEEDSPEFFVVKRHQPIPEAGCGQAAVENLDV